MTTPLAEHPDVGTEATFTLDIPPMRLALVAAADHPIAPRFWKILTRELRITEFAPLRAMLFPYTREGRAEAIRIAMPVFSALLVKPWEWRASTLSVLVEGPWEEPTAIIPVTHLGEPERSQLDLI